MRKRPVVEYPDQDDDKDNILQDFTDKRDNIISPIRVEFHHKMGVSNI